MSQPLICIDNQAGTYKGGLSSSLKLKPPLEALGAQVAVGRYDGDFSFPGVDRIGEFAAVGGEYKQLTEFLTTLTDGRLTGTQLPKLHRTYTHRYVLIEGTKRVSKSGILETLSWDGDAGRPSWQPARGRKGEGWTAQELWVRIGVIERAFGVNFWFSSDILESAAWIMAKWREFQTPLEKHSSWQAWDRSKDKLTMIPTSEQPLVLQWARDIKGVGPTKAAWAAEHFKTPHALANGTIEDWEQVHWTEYLSGGGTRTKHFSRETAAGIVAQITNQATSRRK